VIDEISDLSKRMLLTFLCFINLSLFDIGPFSMSATVAPAKSKSRGWQIIMSEGLERIKNVNESVAMTSLIL
jgi:hypothetical protein